MCVDYRHLVVIDGVTSRYASPDRRREAFRAEITDATRLTVQVVGRQNATGNHVLASFTESLQYTFLQLNEDALL